MGDCEPAVTPAESSSEIISQLFRATNGHLINFLASRLGSVQEAKDIAQEAYMRMLRLPGSPRTPALHRAYLFKIAANLAVDRLRHRGVCQRAAEQTEFFAQSARSCDELEDPAQQVLLREQAHLLLGVLLELPSKSQQAFRLHRLEGMAQRDVAQRLGMSERMVRRHVTYVMLYCRLRLDGASIDQSRRMVTL